MKNVILFLAFLLASCNLPFGEDPTLKFSEERYKNTSSAAPIPGSYVNSYSFSQDGKTLTLNIDQSTAQNISHINFKFNGCDNVPLSLSDITAFTANGVDVQSLLGSTEGKGNSCFGLLADPFVKLSQGFTTPKVVLVITFDSPVSDGQFLIKSSTTCFGSGDPKYSFSRPCVAAPVCYQEESAWASGTRYVNRGNWATYTPYKAGKVAIYAGQNKLAGEVEMSAIIGGNVTLKITLGGDWSLQEVSNPVKIQGYNVAPTGNPAPGRFASKGSSLVVTLPAANFYGIHLDVKERVECQ